MEQPGIYLQKNPTAYNLCTKANKGMQKTVLIGHSLRSTERWEQIKHYGSKLYCKKET